MSSINAIVLMDLQGLITDVNPAFLRMWNNSSERFVKQKSIELFFNEKQRCRNILQTVIREGGWQGEIIAIKTYGGMFPVQASMSLVKDNNDDPVSIIASLVDITKQKRLENKYKRFKIIADKAEYGAFLYDTDWNIFYVNDTFARMHGYDKEEIVGQNMLILYEKSQHERLEHLHTISQHHGGFHSQEMRHKRKDGVLFPVLVTSSLFNDEHGDFSFWASNINDITMLKKKEEELQATKDKLIKLNENLDRKVQERTYEVEKLLEQKNDFITQLGHDLKTPLTPMLALLPILMKNTKDEKDIELFDVVIRNVQYMRELVKKTVDLAKLNSEKMEFTFEPIVLSNEITYLIANNSTLFKEAHITVENQINEDIIVIADVLQLREVLTNLFTNAVKYTNDEQGTITISTSKDHQWVTISVKDTGVGMTQQQLSHIFDEFYKADESRHELDSSGLGLSITKRIVEKHGGHIWAESPGPAQGSTFHFTLRVYQPSQQGSEDHQSIDESNE